MNWKISILFLVFLRLGFGQDTAECERLLNPQELQKDFSIMVSSLQYNHPDLYLYTDSIVLDSVFKSISANLDREQTAVDFYRLTSPIIPFIGNNHTFMRPPKCYVEHINSEALRFPFSLYLLNGEFYVIEDISNEYILKEGARILEINGRAIEEIYQDILLNISTDGYNQTLPELYVCKGFPRMLANYVGLEESYHLRYLDGNGEDKEATINAQKVAQLLENRKARKLRAEFLEEQYSFRFENQVAILRIKSFSIKSNRIYKSFLKKTFQELEESGAKTLVLDLRDNLGGFPEASSELLSFLVSDLVNPTKAEYAITRNLFHDQYFVRDHYYKHFKKQNLVEADGYYHVKGEAKRTIKPSRIAFKGQLYVLMSENSASTTGQVLGLIKSYTDAEFLGVECGGNPVTTVANDLLTLILPYSKNELRIPVIKSELNVNFENNGRGIIPDYEIRSSLRDMTYGTNEQDDQLAAALEYIKRK